MTVYEKAVDQQAEESTNSYFSGCTGPSKQAEVGEAIVFPLKQVSCGYKKDNAQTYHGTLSTSVYSTPCRVWLEKFRGQTNSADSIRARIIWKDAVLLNGACL